MQFSPNDPFPLVETGVISYPETQSHAADVDAWLGLQIEKIEHELFVGGCRSRADDVSGEKQQLWIGLGPRSLLTPYIEIRQILASLNLPKGSVVADLGAAYGRMGFVIGRCFPELNFIGYEYVGERVKEFRRCVSKFNYRNVEMIHADLSASNFHPAIADVYFIYDYGTPKAIRKTLHDLRRIALEKPLIVIGRGRASRDAIEHEHPWLSQVVKPEHTAHYSIYRTTET